MTEQTQIQLSPLQLKQLIFTKVFIELSDSLEKAPELWAPTFDMDGVRLVNETTTGVPETQIGDPRNFMLTMRVAILNDSEDHKKAPYNIDIHAQAWFELAPVFEVSKREDVVRVNGGSMILGAIRELVVQLTARSGFGPLTLPTLRFMPAALEPVPSLANPATDSPSQGKQ